MTFLKLNGWRVPVAAGSNPRKGFLYNGELENSFRNTPTRNRRSVERRWDITTTKLDEACADTLEGFLDSPSHHFPFVVDAWSESGLGPEDGSTWTLNDSGGPIATRFHYVTVGAGNLIYDAGLNDCWTLTWWELISSEWVRRALRSDGIKYQDGVQTVIAFPDVTVGSGGVAFSSGVDLADLTIFPFEACNDFLVADFDWVSGLQRSFYLGLDNSLVDEDSQVPLSTVTGVATVKGQVGQAAEFSAATDTLQYPSNAAFNPDVSDAFSVAFWVRIDPSSPTSRNIVTNVGPPPPFTGFTFQLDALSRVAFSFTSSTDSVSAETDADTDNTWHFYVGTYNGSDTLRLYKDGVLSDTSTLSLGGVATSSANLTFGDSFLLDSFIGAVDEFRFFQRELALADIVQMYRCEQQGRPYPGPTFSSAQPRLDLFGDIQGCEPPIQVTGELSDSSYRQNGSDNGWVNNNRAIQGTLRQVKYLPGEKRVHQPDIAWVFSDQYLAVQPGIGGLDGAIEPAAFKDQLAAQAARTDAGMGLPGPFNYPNQSASFTGAGTDYYSVSSVDPSRAFTGARGATLAAWVRTDNIAPTQIALAFGQSAPDPKIELGLASSRVRGRARSSTSDVSTASLTGTLIPGSDEWCLIAFTVDLETGNLATFIDGKPDASSTVATFSQGRFSDENDLTTVGVSTGLTDSWDGRIAAVYAWRRVLRQVELLDIYNLGIRGVFI